jgi:hypothetical protein
MRLQKCVYYREVNGRYIYNIGLNVLKNVINDLLSWVGCKNKIKQCLNFSPDLKI